MPIGAGERPEREKGKQVRADTGMAVSEWMNVGPFLGLAQGAYRRQRKNRKEKFGWKARAQLLENLRVYDPFWV